MNCAFLCQDQQLLKMLDDKTVSVNENFTNDTKNESEKKNLTNITKISGIYKIVNKLDGKYYIGSSSNIKSRWSKHKTHLKNNYHWNQHLQNAYNKYKLENFEFIIVEQCSIDNLLIIEQKYLDICKSNPETNYMISYDAIAPMRGRIPWNKGKTMNFPAWNKGLKNTGGRIKGFVVSEETKIKLRNCAQKQFSGHTLIKHQQMCKLQSHREKISQGKKDKTIHTFQHTITKETFVGCKYDWYMKYFGKQPCNCTEFMKGNRKTLHNWILIN